MSQRTKVWEGEATDDTWADKCEEGYEAIAAAFDQKYDWVGHFEFFAMSTRGAVYLASGMGAGENGYAITYYAVLTKVT